MKKNFELLANYNQWMNEIIYTASASLESRQLMEDKGAYFGSVFKTLNHILLGDTIWLKRFSHHPAAFSSLKHLREVADPESLSELLYSNFEALSDARKKMDDVIVKFSIEATEEDYNHCLEYENSKKNKFSDNFSLIVQHFYNHQTHHRGQVTTLLNQMGIDCGVTDMLVKIREM